ncbi:SH3 domain-containing protein [Cypionkella sp.]|uniref:SH3 domain-containing protein n=1 Tax=Cypionkella sp. TaxID=2811411 RepID=UPI00261FA503|nr:SH3 domain-containing protein [Cypionkella sp.]MDB5664419.1 hypothetical protein [Cypionkella sp.]
MFKLTFFLCAGLFAVMYLGGADRGQQRFGLIAKTPVAGPGETLAKVVEVVPAPAILSVTEANFVPDVPLIAAPPVESIADASSPKPALMMVVTAKTANVRSGPGKDFDVVERLVRGESVLVVSQGEGADDWSLIRIEGDGVEGYVASRLLRQ